MRTSKSLIASTALFVLFAAPLAHAAGAHSIYLEQSVLPGDADVEFKAANGSKTESTVNGSSGGKGALMYQYLFDTEKTVSFLIGAGLEVNRFKYGSSTDDQVGIRVEPGMAFNISPNFRVETVGVVSLGVADDDNKATDGGFSEIGALVRPVYIFNNGVRLSGHVGYVSNNTGYKHDDKREWIHTRDGATAGIGIGYQFGR